MQKIGRYEIVEKIGEGGMGTVYKAVLPTLNRTVALKVLSDQCAKDRELLERFLREARIMAGLSDFSHVVQVFDLDEFDGAYFYTMEYIPDSLAHVLGEAETVDDRTRRVKSTKKALEVQTAVKIAEHLLMGLKVVHAAGIIHRDISPHNVMLVKEDGGFRAKLNDFGIAGIRESHLTKTGMGGIGKEVYCAPEQWDGLSSADSRSDLYSVGILMYRMVTGKLPMGLRIKQASELNPEVGPELNEWILAATEQDPDDRYKDAGTMLSELIASTSVNSLSSRSPGSSAGKPAQNVGGGKRLNAKLRSEPKNVSDNEFKSVFNLDENGRPKHYIKNDYEDAGNDTVIDHATGLTWQQSGSENYMAYKPALEYVRELNRKRFAGFDDWRLPTVDELASLLEPEEQSNDLFINPIFDETQRYCWTSDQRGSGSAWPVYFGNGYVDWYDLDGGGYYVRAVRARQSEI